MKKILLVITKSNWGGAQRYVYNLATSLPKGDHRLGRDTADGGFEVAVALGGTGVAGSDVGELARRLEVARIPTFFVQSFARDVSFLSDFKVIFELYHLFKTEKPDVVHLNSSKAGGVGALAARLAGVKNIIFTSHGLVWDEDRNIIAKFLIKTFSWLTFLLCHEVIVISQDNFARAQRLPLCVHKIRLVHSGLPELTFETRERARVSLAVRIGLTQDANTFWVGTISELVRNKGLSYLVEAVGMLAGSTVSASTGSATNSTPDPIPFHVFIIGSGDEEQALKKQITESGLENVVHLVGFVADAYRYNKAFDVFTLTSVKEGLPTVLLEAGQAGVPVIATNISGAQDIVEDGKTGLLIETKNPKQIADALQKLIAEAPLRKTLSENLQQKVTQEFSIERMVEETKRLYLQ